MDFSKVGVTRLNSRNFRSWSFKVKMILMREGLWDRVDPGTPPNPSSDAWTEGDAKAMATIVLLVEDNQHNLIMDKKTAKTTWDALKAHHHKTSLTGKVALLKEVCSTNYQEGENMEEFLYGMEDLFSRLENSGEQLSAHMQVAMLLRSMPKAFDTLTTALESRTDKELTMDLVRSKLIDESEKLYGTGSFVGERVLKAVGETKARDVVCFFWGQKGHLKRQCQEYLEKKKQENTEQRVRKVRENDEQSFTFMVRRDKSPLFARSWLLDSGATSHFCSDVNLFVRLESVSRSNVVVADGTERRAEGIGDCRIECYNGSGELVELTLTDVLFVPSLEGNMISISKLTAKGVRARFDSSVCKLVFANKVIAIGDKKCDMYWLRTGQERVAKVVGQLHHEKNGWHSGRVDHQDSEVLGLQQVTTAEESEGAQENGPAAAADAALAGVYFEEELAGIQSVGRDDDPPAPVPVQQAPGSRRSRKSTAGVPIICISGSVNSVHRQEAITNPQPTDEGLDMADKMKFLRVGLTNVPNFPQQKEEMGKQLRPACLVGVLLFATVIILQEKCILGRRVQPSTRADWMKADNANDQLPLFQHDGDVIGCGYRGVTLSSTKAEYLTMIESMQKPKWTNKRMKDIGKPPGHPILAKEENQSCFVGTKTAMNLVRERVVYFDCNRSAAWKPDLLAAPLPKVNLGIRRAIGIDASSAEEEC